MKNVKIYMSPAKWYFSFFVLIVISFSLELFFHMRNQEMDSFDFGLNIVMSEMWEEVEIFRVNHGFIPGKIEWTPNMVDLFQEAIEIEFYDETIDARLKAFGLIRIMRISDEKILYESSDIKEFGFQFTDWINDDWRYKPYSFNIHDKNYAGIGYLGTRLNDHYFIGTIFSQESYEELNRDPQKYESIVSKIRRGIKRQGADVSYQLTQKIQKVLNENNAWTYVYFFEKDSMLSSLTEIETDSLFVPQSFNEKKYLSTIEDTFGNSYRQYSEIYDSINRFAYRIDIAFPLEYVYFNIFKNGLYIFTGAFLIIVFAGIGGRSLKRKAMKPVNNVIKIVNELSSNNIDHRIPDNNVDKNISGLISTFNNLLDRLAKAFKQQKSFIADTSHELRTPLSLLSLDIAEALKNVNGNSEVTENLTEAKREIGHLTRIVSDLEWIAKNDAGQINIEKKHIRLDEVLMESMGRCQKITSNNKTRLVVEKLEVIEYFGDDELLMRSYSNLITNAIKYSKSGGVVKLSLVKKKSKVVFLVEDQGIGIPEKSLSKIFDRFYRVDKSRSRETGGSGLGLVIAKQIAELHNGTIKVKSVLHKGSIFSLELPGIDSL